MFLISITDGQDIYIVGTISKTPRKGWRYNSFSQQGNGRKFHQNYKDAVPHKFKGYLVRKSDSRSALELVIGYRNGENWANDEALTGNIEIV